MLELAEIWHLRFSLAFCAFRGGGCFKRITSRVSFFSNASARCIGCLGASVTHKLVHIVTAAEQLPGRNTGR